VAHVELRRGLARVVDDVVVYIVIVDDVRYVTNGGLALASLLLVMTIISCVLSLTQPVLLVLRIESSVVITGFSHRVFCHSSLVSL
jgi:hypothetical protein